MHPVETPIDEVFLNTTIYTKNIHFLTEVANNFIQKPDGETNFKKIDQIYFIRYYSIIKST